MATEEDEAPAPPPVAFSAMPHVAVVVVLGATRGTSLTVAVGTNASSGMGAPWGAWGGQVLLLTNVTVN